MSARLLSRAPTGSRVSTMTMCRVQERAERNGSSGGSAGRPSSPQRYSMPLGVAMPGRVIGLSSLVLWVALTTALAAQKPTGPQPTFRVQVEAVTQDVVVKDERGLFVPDLKQTDFEIYEDGVKQQINSMTMVHGGRVTNVLEAPAAPPEGLLLPQVRRADYQSGRVLVFFLDDLHIQPTNTARIRNVFKKIEKDLVHDGDLIGIVSSGPSAVRVDLTYDHKRLDDVISSMTGAGLTPEQLINLPKGINGPTEIRFRAQVALKTMTSMIADLDKIHERRKALVWVSEGYDFIPFQAARLGMQDPDSPFLQNTAIQDANQGVRAANPCSTDDPSCQNAPFDPKNPVSNPNAAETQNEEFSDLELSNTLLDLTRSANRANTTIYTIDPRGLNGPSDVDQPVDPVQWAEYVNKTQQTLRDLAEETGGVAVVNTNGLDNGLKRIDNDVSDYYVLGYNSTNPDMSHRRRSIEVRVLRRGTTVTGQRKEYVVKTTQPQPVPPTAPIAPPRQ